MADINSIRGARTAAQVSRLHYLLILVAIFHAFAIYDPRGTDFTRLAGSIAGAAMLLFLIWADRRHFLRAEPLPGFAKTAVWVLIPLYLAGQAVMCSQIALMMITIDELPGIVAMLAYSPLLLVPFAAGEGKARQVLVIGYLAIGGGVAAFGAGGLLLVLYLAGATAFAGLGALRRKALEHAPGPHLALTSVLVTTALQVALIIVHDDPTERAELQADPAVAPAFTDEQAAALSELMEGDPIRFFGPTCTDTTYFVNPKQAVSYFFRTDELSGEIQPYGPLDNYALDCRRGKMYFGTGAAGVFEAYRLDLKGSAIPQQDKVYETTYGGNSMVELLANERRLIYATEVNEIGIIDLKKGRETNSYENLGRHFCYLDGYIISRKSSKHLLYSKLSRDKRKIVSTDTVELPLLDRLGQGSLICDRERGLVYLNGYFNGVLQAYTVPGGEPAGRLEIAPGLRYIRMSPDGRYIITSGYVDGRLYFVDAANLTMVKSHMVGPRAHWLNFTTAGDAVLLSTTYGSFRVTIPGADAISNGR